MTCGTCPIAVVDCESSGLAVPGYPVEVGVARPDGSSSSMLVRPHPLWAGRAWEFEAELTHGISREHLHRCGCGVHEVASWLNVELRGLRVLSDAPHADAYWLDELFRAAGIGQEFVVDPMPLADLFFEAAGGGPRASRMLAAHLAAPPAHRAAPDALAWALLMARSDAAGGTDGPGG